MNTYKGKYENEINKIATEYGIDANLIAAIIKVESNFNRKAESVVGAVGLMQLMPGTLRAYGNADGYDVYHNIEIGTKHIVELLHYFNGNIVKVLIAYNAGKGSVDKVLQSGEGKWKEPKAYVKRVLDYYLNGIENYSIKETVEKLNGLKSWRECLEECDGVKNTYHVNVSLNDNTNIDDFINSLNKYIRNK